MLSYSKGRRIDKSFCHIPYFRGDDYSKLDFLEYEITIKSFFDDFDPRDDEFVDAVKQRIEYPASAYLRRTYYSSVREILDDLYREYGGACRFHDYKRLISRMRQGAHENYADFVFRLQELLWHSENFMESYRNHRFYDEIRDLERGALELIRRTIPYCYLDVYEAEDVYSIRDSHSLIREMVCRSLNLLDIRGYTRRDDALEEYAEPFVIISRESEIESISINLPKEPSGDVEFPPLNYGIEETLPFQATEILEEVNSPPSVGYARATQSEVTSELISFTEEVTSSTSASFLMEGMGEHGFDQNQKLQSENSSSPSPELERTPVDLNPVILVTMINSQGLSPPNEFYPSMNDCEKRREFFRVVCEMRRFLSHSSQPQTSEFHSYHANIWLHELPEQRGITMTWSRLDPILLPSVCHARVPTVVVERSRISKWHDYAFLEHAQCYSSSLGRLNRLASRHTRYRI